MAKPTSARHELMARCCHSSPLAERVQNAFNTPSGEGSTRVDSQPTDEASCQTMTVPTGSSQGARRNNRGWVDFAITVSSALRYFTRNKLVGDRFPLQAQVLRLRDGRHRDVKQGEQ